MSFNEEPDYEGDMKREFDKLKARLEGALARAEKAEATASRLNAVVQAYPNATTDLAHWIKPTIALIDAGALQAISPVEEEDADGGTPWPGQCIGALVDGFLALASDVGKHNGDADRLVHNAIDELRKVARELRVAWADRDMAIGALTKCGVALDVHSSSSLVSHAKSAGRQVHDLLCERDQALAACAEQTARAERAEAGLHDVLGLMPVASVPAIAFTGHHGEYVRAVVDAVCAERDTALAACAEMRAALEAAAPHHQGGHSTVGRMIREALDRPDLGAGVVVVPREVVERWRGVIVDGWAGISSPKVTEIIADLDALLKQGGG